MKLSVPSVAFMVAVLKLRELIEPEAPEPGLGIDVISGNLIGGAKLYGVQASATPQKAILAGLQRDELAVRAKDDHVLVLGIYILPAIRDEEAYLKVPLSFGNKIVKAVGTPHAKYILAFALRKIRAQGH